jgi:predicted RNase H-like nuclease (RuvC/YqgF family)
VKYAQITTALVNAVNEQQAIIESHEKQNTRLKQRVEELSVENQRLQAQIDGLLKAVCALNPEAAICREER